MDNLSLPLVTSYESWTVREHQKYACGHRGLGPGAFRPTVIDKG